MSQRLSAVLRKSYHRLWHWCPGCNSLHTIPVDAPDATADGKPHQWKWDGNAESPTVSPSVNYVGVCHYTITEGKIQFHEGRHALAGQTVPMPEFPNHEDWTEDGENKL